MPDSPASKRKILQQIREKLADIWNVDKADIRRVLMDLQIDIRRIDFDGAIINVWDRAAFDAARRGKLPALLEKAGEEDPSSKGDLESLRDAFAAAPGEIWLPPLDPKAYPLNENCPYVGLRRFEEEDRPRFFGRDALVREILEKIEIAPLHLVLGNSGSGKSSVVRAGVIPKWREVNGNDAKAIVFTPDVDPFTGFFAGLLGAGFDQSQAGLAMKRGTTILRDVAGELRKDGGPPWFIFIDQFEEIFTRIPAEGKDAGKRDQFIASIVDLANAQTPGIHLVLAMRDDFFGNLRAHKNLFPLTDNHLIRIIEMDGDSLLEVIERPAVEHGVGFEGDLAEKIASEVEGRPGMLPLLQHTLEALWERDDVSDRTLNLKSYHAIGGVKGALNQKASRYYESLNDEQRQSLRRILLGLVEIGQTEAGWRPVSRRARKSDLVSEADQEILSGLLDREKLLISSGEDDPSIELAHEALIAGWPQFSDWVKESREAIELRNRLRHDAETWRATKEKDPKAAEAELWRGSKLERGLELKESGDFDRLHVPLGPDQAEFLASSLAYRDAARQREISRHRKFSMVAGGLALAAIVGLIAAGFYAKRSNDRLSESRLNEAKAWLERARGYEQEGNHFAAAMMAARGLSFRGFGREGYLSNPEFEERYPELVKEENPEFSALLRLASRNIGAGIPVWQCPHDRRYERVVDIVRSVAFSPDGMTLASGSDDASIELWEVETGQLNQTFTGHDESFQSVAFSPDGAMLAGGSTGNSIKLWEVETGELKLTLTGHERGVESVVFSPDGAMLASGSWDHTIKLWEVETGQLKRTLTGHSSGVATVAFSPDGATLASGSGDTLAGDSADNSIKLWEVETGQLEQTLTGHDEGFSSVAFSPNGVILASGGKDNRIKLWEVETGQLKQTLTGHDDPVSSVIFSPDGVTLASGSWDASIKLWEVATGQLEQTLSSHSSSVIFSPDGTMLASGGFDTSIKLWEMETGQLEQTLAGDDQDVNYVAFSPDGATLASVSSDDSIKFWEVGTGQLKQTFTGHDGEVLSLGFRPDGAALASVRLDNDIKLWEVATGQLEQTFTGHDAKVASVTLSPDGAMLASGGSDAIFTRNHSIKLWEAETGELKQTLTGHSDTVVSVAFSPDGATLASGSYDDSIKLWEVKTGQLKQTLNSEDLGLVDSVTFSPDGATLAVILGFRIELWDVGTGRLNQTLTGHDDSIESVSFSPDGTMLASGSMDNSIKLWEVESGQLLQTLARHDERVTSVVFSPDGTTLASGSWDDTIKLWDSSPVTFDLAAYLEDNWASVGGGKLIWSNPDSLVHPDAALPAPLRRDFAFLNVHPNSFVGILQSDHTEDEKNEALFLRYLRASNWNSAIVMARRLPPENERADEMLVSGLTEARRETFEQGNFSLANFRLRQILQILKEDFLAPVAAENARNSIAELVDPIRLGHLDFADHLWDTDIIRVRFLDGEIDLQSEVFAIASEWTDHCGLEFKVVTEGDADITITLDDDPGAFDSFFGKASRDASPSMRVDGSTVPNEDFRQLVLKTFGRALGLIDELQNPSAFIPWDLERLRQTHPYTIEENFNRRFSRYESIIPEYRDFDSKSIMTGEIPNEHTLTDFEIPANYKLSESDKELIGRLYPKKAEASESDADQPVD